MAPTPLSPFPPVCRLALLAALVFAPFALPRHGSSKPFPYPAVSPAVFVNGAIFAEPFLWRPCFCGEGVERTTMSLLRVQHSVQTTPEHVLQRCRWMGKDWAINRRLAFWK